MDAYTCVEAMTKVVQGFDEAIEAEAMGLLAAIEWTKTLHQQTILIESDNSTVVQALRNEQYPRNYWGQMIRSGGDYVREISVQWIKRSGNKAAHYLARWAE
ncbi:hypothetical protein L195_g023647, partial [Trifolium pratense]